MLVLPATRPVRGCVFCSILPPHILEKMEQAGTPKQREAAAATRAVTRELREGRLRAVAATVAPAPVAARVGTGARTVYDAQNGASLPGTRMRSEGGAPTEDAAVDEAYDGAGATRDFLRQIFARNSIDGAGLPLRSSVHYRRDYDNAFWDGEQMVYGDGDGELFGRFTASIDVIGHEFAHGVTQYTSNLVYFEEPGALNEHFSDVIGSLVKQWSLGQRASKADWLIGAELLAPGVQGRALRSMRKPGTAYDDPRLGRDPQPAHMRHFYHGTDDAGGVHINSGIPNRAFCLAALRLDAYAWESVGPIWWRAFTRMLGPRSSFADAARATMDAAGTLRDKAAADVVAAAWATVGVEPRAARRKPAAKPAAKPAKRPAPARRKPAAKTPPARQRRRA